MQRLLGGAYSSGWLHSDGSTGCEIEVANRFDHHLRICERGAAGGFTRARLDEVAGTNHLHRKERCGTDVVVGIEFAHFENDFQLRVTACFHDSADFLLHRVELAREEESAVD